MSHPLLDMLTNDAGVPVVTAEEAVAFTQDCVNEIGVVFFTADPVKKLETADVAVVLRELLSLHAGRLKAVMVARDAEREAMDSLGVRVMPSLAFFHAGERLEIIAKIQDWSVYAEKIPALLARAGLMADA